MAAVHIGHALQTRVTDRTDTIPFEKLEAFFRGNL